MSILGDSLIFDKDKQIDIYATISVTYPEGSVCSITNGDITMTAQNTNGQVLFGVPKPALFTETWTVSSTNGKNTAEQEIIINEYGQYEEVTLIYISSILNNNEWEIISEIAQAGTGDQYWDIGDCKEIVLNGTIGTLALSNYTTYVYIIDFNHPINKSTTDNNIIFGGFKSALTSGKDIALCDSGYSGTYTSSTKYFNINHYGSSGGFRNTNFGGWKGCDLRYDVLGATSSQPSYYNTYKRTANTGYNATQVTITSPVSNTLMAALPSDFRSVLRLWNRYIDFVGNKSNTEANCSTATVDAGISLLAEYEIFGTRTIANTYEQNHQKQMGYYSDGNSKVKYRHNYQNTAITYWTASPHSTTACRFCDITTAGASSNYLTNYSYGVAPVFKV